MPEVRPLKENINDYVSSLQVTDVWSLSLEDRWRLYRRWVQDVRERYRRDMSFFHFDFERGVRELKQIKSQLDLLILKKAAVIGMTTTGKYGYTKFGCFLLFRKLFLVSYCVVLWALFTVFSIFYLNSFGDHANRKNKKLSNIFICFIKFLKLRLFNHS